MARQHFTDVYGGSLLTLDIVGGVTVNQSMPHLIAPTDVNQVYAGYVPFMTDTQWKIFAGLDEKTIIQSYIHGHTSCATCGSQLSILIGTKVFESNNIFRK